MKDIANKDFSKGGRPQFPKRAVITAGMPYGNKELHFGHIGGVFVHADTFARFLRDRIGSENVIFVSGTDCYGSPILESYRKLVESNKDKTVGTIEEYVRKNHNIQKETLSNYGISLDLYGASALDRPGEIHKEVSKEIFEKLYSNGDIVPMSTPQFYDTDFQVFLNGRQVVGQCPIEGCTSEKAYADECSLGHQYMPSDLLNPKSTLSGKTPEVREVTNWYFKLEEYQDRLKDWIRNLRVNTNTRKYIINTIEEFLKPPYIYVKKDQLENLPDIDNLLPQHNRLAEENKASLTFVFDNLNDRDIAKEIFASKGIRFRTGKTLVPFRLSGNIEWGVPVPDKDDLMNLTFWVWPESLWAPISFTRAYLESQGKESKTWTDWWNSKESKVYQFIGEDNIYFYGIAEMALFASLDNDNGKERKSMGELPLPHLIANRHILFMDKKASSSNEIKPPMAKDLLEFYTPEQLRIHFLSLGLSTKSVSFRPQVYMDEKDRYREDIVIKEGNLLTNVLNRLVRSCFYTSQSYFESRIPKGEISEKILSESEEAILNFERHMYNHEFHSLTYVLDTYIRNMNKYWVNNMRTAETTGKTELRKQILIDSFHVVKTAAILLHPIAPIGCERIKDYLNVSDKIWNWDYIFSTIYDIIDDMDNHKLKFLEPKTDFFKKHVSQLER
ncbi:methionine--tRNA ligase [Anaerocolumna sp. MB42-C2]|uniref:methionine--tRNA ligase n=1 Tax=Anaerocolumna sp. MB42-C2 TaxID=3070997 RepID=UPI0027E04925|nr:class I tRNA ligase family protein [Anaerocolumna sp. MB42-C2]WMJ87703.1 class I tRNA ligase family protein [Anaerocolumna sp. MB42-C2]